MYHIKSREYAGPILLIQSWSPISVTCLLSALGPGQVANRVLSQVVYVALYQAELTPASRVSSQSSGLSCRCQQPGWKP